MQVVMSSVSSLFTKPYEVRKVQLSEYSGGSDKLKEEGRIVLYKNGSSWDCLLICPDTPMTALRLFQVSSEADALNWFPHYALKLLPFYEILPLPNPKVFQPIVDSLRSHPDWSSAHIAVDTGLKECLKHNYVQSQINACDGSGQTPLHLACERGDVGCVRVLLEECQARTDVKDNNGETPMHCAAKQDSPAIIQICRMLLDNKCEVNYLSKTGESPLHILTRRGRFEASMVLLTHGANPNLRGMDGNTSLHLAMKMEQLDLIKALIVFGADVEMPNDLGETPGLLAACASKGSNRKVLLDMLYSVGVQRCAPPFSPLDPQPPSTPRSVASPPGIGFEDIMDVSASVGAMSRGLVKVDTVKPKRDRLLCLDGGGIRGLVLIQLLIALEKEAGRPIKELFDWISGTSTGGILALAIVHGKDMEYLRSLYFRMKEQVFQGSRPYKSAPLEHFLKKEFGENTMMTDVRHPRVMVTGVLADRDPGELHIFRNYDPPSLPQERPYSSTANFKPLTIPQEQVVWRAARSTGAAPTYFKPLSRFLDGGLLANNPTLDAMTEIHQYNKALKAEGRGAEVQPLGVVVSLGTGKPPQVVVNSVDVFWPSSIWEVGKAFLEGFRSVEGFIGVIKIILDCCTDSDGCAVDRARAWCEMIDATFRRLSPQLSQAVKLDEVSDSVLVDMLWETQLYLYEHRETIKILAEQLLY